MRTPPTIWKWHWMRFAGLGYCGMVDWSSRMVHSACQKRAARGFVTPKKGYIAPSSATIHHPNLHPAPLFSSVIELLSSG